jgi:hypothetical protein
MVPIEPKGESDQNEDPGELTEFIKNLLFTALCFSVFALIIFGIGQFSWWIALALNLIFAICVLFRLLLTGSVLLIGGLITRLIYRFINARGLNPKKFDETYELTRYAVLTSIVLPAVEVIYLLFITIALGVSFFR